MASAQRLLSGWGGATRTSAAVVEPRNTEEVAGVMRQPPRRGVIARGLGRGYGDAAQNAGGTVLLATALDRISEVDPTTGTVTVGAGASLDTLMRRLVPRGWFLPVVPGTRWVTVGGAIAADIHGKNHHREGTLAAHLVRLRLETPTGAHELSPTAGRELYWATTGGMGLTGVVTEATLWLRPVTSAWIRRDTERAEHLDDLLARLSEGDAAFEYSVAWLDLLAVGRKLGRGVLTRGQHASVDDLPAARRTDALRFAPATHLAAPPAVPPHLLTPVSIRAFNELWFRRAPRQERGRMVPLASFFQPLDGIRGWNRLYGPAGFVQYQFVVPVGAEGVLRSVIQRLAAAHTPSFLAVLKRFGAANPAPLSFPLAGWTLALDIPARVPGLGAVLDACDELIAGAGGRVYLAKDSRLRPELLEAMYPRLGAWRRTREAVDPERLLQSDLDRRLDLTGRRA